MTTPHISVLLNEILHFFEDKTVTYFVDGTLGAGGHSAAILNQHPELIKLIGIDQDPVAREIAKERLVAWNEKVCIIQGNFDNLTSLLDNLKIDKVDGILLDLGVSSMQFDIAEKGFSFMRDGPLDMRMNPEESLTAAEIINTWTEHQLGRVFRDYGEEKQWRQAARTIVSARQEKPINTTLELAEILKPIFAWKKKGINPLTLIFQALRICVNRELEVVEVVIDQAINRLNSGGILAIISFHSLEDRIVKNKLRFAASDKYDTSGIGGVFLNKTPLVKPLTRKPIVPGFEEISLNPRSRSAKLRVVEKL